MVVFPNCKINLGLHVISKRDDGYHNIETIFYPLPLYDVLEVVENKIPLTQLFLSGIEIEGETNNNLCIKAYDLLKKDFPHLPFIKIYLHKNIPAGAGLGGGSADGAFMLKLLNEKFSLNLNEASLLQYALQLGSDCPFFIINKPCLAQSRGEDLKEIKVDLSGYKLILINTEIHIKTGWAFAQLSPSSPKKNIKECITQPIHTWKNSLQNDFELPVFSAHPSLQKIKNDLYNAGALYAAMSGSGSTFFGIFDKLVNINDVTIHGLPQNYYI